MTTFFGDHFLLTNDVSRRLYHEVAAGLPIIDYHCHLPPSEIAQDRRYDNMAQIWLEGDHYKWRALRAAGVEERLITGAASEREKYDAWAAVVPQCLGNPLYTWTHLELRRPFGICDTVFGPNTADKIWTLTQEMLSQPGFSAQGIMQQMQVKMVGTTDDPIHDLQHHKHIAANPFGVKVLPSFRPDRAYKIELDGFAEYMTSLGQATNTVITRFHHLLDALTQRLDYFAEHGCTIADHGIEILRFAEPVNEAALDIILAKRLNNEAVSELDIAQFFTAVNIFLGQQYAKRNWVMQLHMGAQRDNNTRMLNRIGPNSGFDSIGDSPLAAPLAGLLNAMEATGELPKTILYCINPSDNEVLATMAGNFQGVNIASKVQFGSGWWFNDQKDGMQRQLMQLSQLGMLSHFVGMLTDSRSFLSYTRHEYFRRILCEMVGGWVVAGEAPNDWALLSGLIANVCFHNANRYFELGLDPD